MKAREDVLNIQKKKKDQAHSFALIHVAICPNHFLINKRESFFLLSPAVFCKRIVKLQAKLLQLS